MKRLMISTAFAWIAMFALARPALADLKVCNTGEREIRFAYIVEVLGFVNRGWLASGWYEILPGACRTIFGSGSV